MEVFIIILIPFIGTALGAGMVFFLKDRIKPSLQRLLSGFAAGVMISASIWSLLIPSVEMAEMQNKISWLPATIGFLVGILFLLLLDKIIPHLHVSNTNPEGIHSSFKETTMLVLAVTLHNIPEGMAVGVTIAGAINNSIGMTLVGAMALAIGIAIQNFPEGAIISMPLRTHGVSKRRAFVYGTLSGIVEPVATCITILLTNLVTPFLSYVLAFAAGAMMYVVVEELIPESQEKTNSDIGTIGIAIGFVLMMVLDIALG